MRYCRLGDSSLHPSVIGLGALHFGVFLNQKKVNQIVSRALDLGINFIDTSPIYGNGHSETMVGNSLEGRRDKVIVTTKAGLRAITRSDGTFGNEVARLTRNYIRTSVENSLKNLRTDYIDLFQLHAFDNHTPLEETLEILDQLRCEGKIRYIACSNYNPKEFEITMQVAEKLGLSGFVASQCQLSMIERRAELELIPICIKYGASTICNRSLSKGILTGKYKKGGHIPSGSRGEFSQRVRMELDDNILLLVEELDKFSRKCGRSVTELALAWVLSRNSVSTILVGCRNIEQLETCIKSVNWSLSEKEIIEIDSIIEKFGLLSRVNSLPQTFLEK